MLKIMFKISQTLIAGATATLIISAGTLAATPLVFSGRVLPGVNISANVRLSASSSSDAANILNAVEENILNHTVTLQLNNKTINKQLKQLGVTLDKPSIMQTLYNTNITNVILNKRRVATRANIDTDALSQQMSHDFSAVINHPTNASLTLTNYGKFVPVPSKSGDKIDIVNTVKQLQEIITNENFNKPLVLKTIPAQAEVQDNEIEPARQYAGRLIKDGLMLTFADEKFTIKPSTIKRLISFTEQVDPQDHGNKVLGVKFNSGKLASYLEKTVAPAINQQEQDARFVIVGEKVEQFAMPRQGRKLNLAQSARNIAATLAKHKISAPLVIDITDPQITDTSNIEKMGLTRLVSTGESDYVGSPKNRVHNILVGANRYHGLLIPPNTEFSFNHHLGPVDASAGFLPELVIKENVTTPEFGGGLCQVSTTMFRAALNAGLKITQRRNHSYPVRYYGKPGLDATIYPPYTDLRFLNNTPGYILIQTRIEGTKLAFDFWGTSDSRQVSIEGPISYDQQPDGAIKAYVTQKVTKGGQVIIDDTFYSRYKSPKLFPKVLAASSEPQPKEPAVNSEAGEEKPPADKPPKTNENKQIQSTPKPTPASQAAAQPKPSLSPAPAQAPSAD